MTDRGLYIGLMSGTSADAIDVALVRFDENKPHLISTLSTPLPSSIRQEVHLLATPGNNEIDRLGQLDHELGIAFSDAINQLIHKSGIDKKQIIAIGSHGQTIRHRPSGSLAYPFTLQIGDPNIIAHQTGITTVADFRRRDMAAGGQGAPLVPAFHKAIFQSALSNRAVINIGGMANITWLPTSGVATGFDTGPGNVLMDAWIYQQQGKSYDTNGDWAASGKVHEGLLAILLQHPFFSRQPPKSTGREEFNFDWLSNLLASHSINLPAEDIQATLTSLTATSIVNALQSLTSDDFELFVCGGGAYNFYLMNDIKRQLPNISVESTAVLGIEPQWVEAMAFAWLAKQTMHHQSGNLCSVTGAKQEVILGGVYSA